jgi:UDP-N-acetylmuramate--alanine ligase
MMKRTDYKHVHLIGIGGSGLSAIATVLLGQGYEVSGSDVNASPITDHLAEQGARVYIGHAAEQVHGADAVVVSSAVPMANPEVVEAHRLGIPVFKRADWLGRMMEGYEVIAVAGTHGKTTTTALLALALRDASLDPTFIAGGVIPELGSGATVGSGRYFVVEADEYDYTFLGLRPQIAVITAVEWDHPDCFPSEETLRLAFRRFLGLVPPTGAIVACGDEPGVRAILTPAPPVPAPHPPLRSPAAALTRRCASGTGEVQVECRQVQAEAPVTTYGLGADNDWQAEEIRINAQGGHDFVARQGKKSRGTFSLAIPGLHNVKNALAVLAVADQLELELEGVGDTLRRFRGVARRFETKGEVGGVAVIDDYAHHPTEIHATLAAARTRYPGRTLWVVFQPHTFSRTRALLDQFAASFTDADHVIITAIFAARERDDGSITAGDIVAHMHHRDARYIPALDEAVVYLLEHLKPGDVLMTIGAGDGYKVGEKILELYHGPRAETMSALPRRSL